MTFQTAKPYKPAPSGTGTGISFGVRGTKRPSATLHFTAQFMEDHWGESIVGASVVVKIGRGSDQGYLRVEMVPEGADAEDALTVIRGIKGSATVKFETWDMVGREPVKAQPCRVADFKPDGMIVQLPEWCRPGTAEHRKAVEERHDFALKV